jgi:hypothetical protein
MVIEFVNFIQDVLQRLVPFVPCGQHVFGVRPLRVAWNAELPGMPVARQHDRRNELPP